MPGEPAHTATREIEPSGLLRPSVIILILANLGPVYGVLFLGWTAFPVIFLFWVENLIIGGLNVCRMLLADPRNKSSWMLKVFLIPFFCFHYGLFTYVHGIFVMGFFGGMFQTGAPFPDSIIVMGFIRDYKLGWAIVCLTVSHCISFWLNYIGGGEYLMTGPIKLMQQPYSRVVVLHFTILAGGVLVMILNSPLVGLLLLVALKLGLDIRSHMREHKIAVPPEPQAE